MTTAEVSISFYSEAPLSLTCRDCGESYNANEHGIWGGYCPVCMPRRGDYPDDWKTGEIQKRIHNLAGWRCEHCGMEFPRGSTKAKTARNSDGNPVILTVHHLDGRPANCDWRNLLACCQRCHLHIQAVWAPGDLLPLAWDGPPEWLSKRGLSFKTNPQMRLF